MNVGVKHSFLFFLLNDSLYQIYLVTLAQATKNIGNSLKSFYLLRVSVQKVENHTSSAVKLKYSGFGFSLCKCPAREVISSAPIFSQ